MSEASAGLEITGGVSPPDRSARVIGEVRPPDKKPSLMSQFARPLSQHEGRAHKAQNDAEFRAVQENHAAMLAHNKATRQVQAWRTWACAHEQCPAACNCRRASEACAGDMRVKCDLFTRR
eukprot:366245-Chlamydomonas_euryale.AAC.43